MPSLCHRLPTDSLSSPDHDPCTETEDSTSNYAASNSARLEQDGVVAEKENAVKSQSRTQRVNDTMQHSSQTAAMSANR